MRNSVVGSRRTHLWVVIAVLASVLPLYFRQANLRDVSGLVDRAYLVAVFATIIAGTAALRDRRVAAHFVQNLKNSPHILLYCAWLLISQSLISLVYGDIGWSDIVRVGGYMLVAFVGYLLLPCAIGQRGIAAWWNLLLVVGTVVSGLGLFVVATGQVELFGLRLTVNRYLAFWDLYATSSFFNEPSISGFASVLGVVAGAHRLYTQERLRTRLVTLVLMGICVTGVLFSLSRAMYLALSLAASVWLLVGSHVRTKLVIIFGSGILVAAVMHLATSSFLAVYFLEPNLGPHGLAGREILWPAAIRAILDRPITGYGMNPYLLITTVYRYGGVRWVNRPMGAHNGFLDLGVQAGLLLPVLYVYAIVITFARLFTSSAPLVVKRSFAAAMTVAVVATMFLSYSLGGASYGSLVLTILFGLGNAMPLFYAPVEREQEYSVSTRGPDASVPQLRLPRCEQVRRV